MFQVEVINQEGIVVAAVTTATVLYATQLLKEMDWLDSAGTSKLIQTAAVMAKHREINITSVFILGNTFRITRLMKK